MIGDNKFAYDIWGDAMQMALLMEDHCEPGRINISERTHDYIKYFFQCELHGEAVVENGTRVRMFYLNRLQEEFSADPEGTKPNKEFLELYRHRKEAGLMA